MFLSNKSSAASAFLRTAYLAGGDELDSPTCRNIFLTMEKNYTNAIRYPASTWPICSIPFPRPRFGPRFGAQLWLHNIKTTFSCEGPIVEAEEQSATIEAERIVIPANIFVRPCTTARHA
jgi:hypothetical protein